MAAGQAANLTIHAKVYELWKFRSFMFFLPSCHCHKHQPCTSYEMDHMPIQAVNGRGREQGQSNRDGAAPSQLPSCLYALLDAQCSAELPPPQRMRGVRLNNRELDKLVNNLGRNPATWRRSLLLHTWLQVSINRPSHNISYGSLLSLTPPVPSRNFYAFFGLTTMSHMEASCL